MTIFTQKEKSANLAIVKPNPPLPCSIYYYLSPEKFKPMDWEEILNPLSPYYQNSMSEQTQIVNLQDGLIASAKRLMANLYPQLYELESKGYTELDSTIISECVKLSCRLNEIVSKYQIQK
jgi:hypothetical protein